MQREIDRSIIKEKKEKMKKMQKIQKIQKMKKMKRNTVGLNQELTPGSPI